MRGDPSHLDALGKGTQRGFSFVYLDLVDDKPTTDPSGLPVYGYETNMMTTDPTDVRVVVNNTDNHFEALG
jgi:hypothetical protein